MPKEGANGAIAGGGGIEGNKASPGLIGVCGCVGYFWPVGVAGVVLASAS